MRTTSGTSSPSNVSTKEQRIAHLARQAPNMAMDLSHHMDIEWLKEAFRRTRKDGAVGVDGVSGEDYSKGLDLKLHSLLDASKSGLYRAPAVKRVYILKQDGKSTRPLGIPTFEDKVLQRAVVMLLNPVYEQDFLTCSYGFRPSRSAHQALQVLWDGLMSMGGGYVIDLDIKDYFTSIDHKTIQGMVRKRVRDGVVCQLIGKWLNARVIGDGTRTAPKSGVPQGGVISPLISNIYLHEVLDKWFSDQVLPVMKGKAFVVRFADDAVLAFERKTDAARVYSIISRRFAKFGLTLHPEKTRMLNFRRGCRRDTFDFLGFTHYWGISQKGNLVIKRRTSRKRFKSALGAARRWLKEVKHWTITQQHRELCLKLRGYFQYYGITGNGSALAAFLFWVRAAWFKCLKRRSHTSHRTCKWFEDLCQRFKLPSPSPVHSILRRAAKPGL